MSPRLDRRNPELRRDQGYLLRCRAKDPKDLPIPIVILELYRYDRAEMRRPKGLVERVRSLLNVRLRKSPEQRLASWLERHGFTYWPHGFYSIRVDLRESAAMGKKNMPE